MHYFSVNPNAEAELVKIALSSSSSARIKEFDFGFSDLEIKGRGSLGNTVTRYPIKSVKLKESGISTIAGKKLWFDEQFGRLNTDEKGQYLGMFDGEDKVLVFYRDGNYEVTDQELTQKLDAEKLIHIEKFNPEKVISAVYVDMKNKQFMAKRFRIETTTLKNKFLFIKEGEGNYVETVTTIAEPVLAMQQGRGAQIRKGKLKIAKIAEITNYKTVGTKLADFSKSTEMEWVKTNEDPNQTELFQ